jgi:hypothetical protein
MLFLKHGGIGKEFPMKTQAPLNIGGLLYYALADVGVIRGPLDPENKAAITAFRNHVEALTGAVESGECDVVTYASILAQQMNRPAEEVLTQAIAKFTGK